MSKFDRGVFIFIGLGIWALAMVHSFKPDQLKAGYNSRFDTARLTTVTGKCPNNIKSKRWNEETQMHSNVNCSYILVANYEDLRNNPDYFK